MKKQDYDRLAASLDAKAVDGISFKSAVAIASGKHLKPNKLNSSMGIHPLAKFVDFDGKVRPPRWVIPGFIGHGVTVISGAPGVGKTTAILPLAMTAAGLFGDKELMPIHWRQVVYVTEDVEQVLRILAGIINFSNLDVDIELARERLHIVAAVRLSPDEVSAVGTNYRAQFTRIVKGIEVLPLVVLDTKSAVLAMESENDNSEASAMLAALKQGFDELPIWLLGHIAKANLNRADVALLTSRGAGAIDGDATQTLFVLQEGARRFLMKGKVRFEPRWPELEIVSHSAQTYALDEFGNSESVEMRWGIAQPALQSRMEAAKQAKEDASKVDATELRQAVRDTVQLAWQSGNPLNRSGVKAKVQRNSQIVGRTIENLLSEQWLYEVPVPREVRPGNSKVSFLVNLSTEEHDIVMSGGGLPTSKLEIPVSWQKPVVLLVPALHSEQPKGYQ
jgi:hypothetical protein